MVPEAPRHRQTRATAQELICSAARDSTQTRPSPTYDICRIFIGAQERVYASYRLLFGVANQNINSASWSGWNMYDTSTAANPRAPAVKLGSLGQDLLDPLVNRSHYVAEPAQQPLALDCADFQAGIWQGVGLNNIPNNHGSDGENIVYMDGHATWKTPDQTTRRMQFSGATYAYW